METTYVPLYLFVSLELGANTLQLSEQQNIFKMFLRLG